MHSVDSAAELHQAVDGALAHCAPLDGGAVADYIPELAKADPSRFSIAVCTIDGDVVAAGDADCGFTLQSVCKPFLYAQALRTLGADTVHERVGVEPSGERFDAIVEMETGTHRPHNPMVNDGALAVASLLQAASAAPRPSDLLLPFTDCESLQVDEAAYQSENATADRNRAIAYLMAHLDMLACPPEEALYVYLQACSTLVTCRDLAVMGATLAAGGHNPRTHTRVLDPEVTRDVLAIMSTCGMYDGTGRFEVEVGMPAKSGVAGGALAVAPGRLGLAVLSPRLDDHGNTVRGMAALREVAHERSLHMFDATAPTAIPVRTSFPAIRDVLRDVHERIQRTSGGAIAEYLRGTANADENAFGIAACTVQGEECHVGDAKMPFTIQAAANPFTYAVALSEYGAEAVHARVGVEPSGNPYDAIQLHPLHRRPHNALGNAGAIATAGLFAEDPRGDGEERLARAMARFAGRDAAAVDESVLALEQANDRNRAIAYLLRNCGVIGDVDGAFALYARQCARSVSTVDLARMAAVFAAGGRHPVTGDRLVTDSAVPTVLTVMYTCGMHDASGRFAFDIGLPGKSGVSGCLLAVVPGAMGLALFAPPVDGHGTSVRGFAALRAISRALDLGVFARAG